MPRRKRVPFIVCWDFYGGPLDGLEALGDGFPVVAEDEYMIESDFGAEPVRYRYNPERARASIAWTNGKGNRKVIP